MFSKIDLVHIEFEILAIIGEYRVSQFYANLSFGVQVNVGSIDIMQTLSLGSLLCIRAL